MASGNTLSVGECEHRRLAIARGVIRRIMTCHTKAKAKDYVFTDYAKR
jgi:hypothetical protein